jgi:hypothetical protein
MAFADLLMPSWLRAAGAARGVVLALCIASGFVAGLPCAARAQPAPDPLIPTFAELEAAGARYGSIRIVTRDVFDLDDPAENKLLFRWANALHVVTRPEVIGRSLLFKSGDPVSVRQIEETERVLRSLRYVYDVTLSAVAYRDGVVDVVVTTRDTWTLDVGAGASRSGGTNSGSAAIRESNLLGTGIGVSIGGFSNVDRNGVEFQVSDERAFDGWTSVGFGLSRNSDGERMAARLVHPFYSLDTRWAAGITTSSDDRIEPVYSAGEIVSQYRRRDRVTEAFGGWSDGLVDGWVRRYSFGVRAQETSFAPEPGLVAPPVLSPDERLVGPFVRYDLIEDRYEKRRNLSQMGRPEFLALGLNASFQLGRAMSSLGSTTDAWLYSAAVSRGFEPTATIRLLASGTVAGRWAQGDEPRLRAGGQVQYYHPQGARWLFYASAAGEMLNSPSPLDTLTVGGDTGLRGYPLRYQSGSRRAVFTLEERVYTDLYLYRLFRVGGAAFFDAGRAWGGADPNPVDPGWLANIGVGLRIFSVRAGSSTVLHLDIAMPLNADPAIKSVQFLVRTRSSF